MILLRLKISTSVLAIWLLVSPALAVEDNAFTNALKGLIDQAEEGLAQGELQLAESHYRVALLETWMQLAMLEVAAGDWPAARDALVESTRSAATGERRTRSSLALVQLWLDETDKALEQLRDLARRHPKNTQVRQLFAQALLAVGHVEEAGRELEDMRPRAPKVVEMTERYVASFNTKEREAGEKAEWPERREAFLPALGAGAFEGLTPDQIEEEKVRLRATLVRLYENLAVLHHEHPDCAERLRAHGAEAGVQADVAATAWKEAAYGTVDLNPEDLVPIQPLRVDVTALWQSAGVEHLSAMRHLEAGEIDAAEGELRKMLEQGEDAVARNILGVLLADRGELEQAREHFAAIIEATPDFLPARQHLLRLDLLSESHDPEKIAAELRALAELGPLERDLELELADIQLAAGEVDAGRQRLFDTAHRFNSPKALLRLAEVFAAQGESRESVKHAIKAMRLAPSSKEVLATYARHAHRAGQAGEAIGAIEPLVSLYPHVAEYHFLNAMAVMARQDAAAARTALEKALAIDPTLAEAHGELATVCAQLEDSDCAKRHLELYREALLPNADNLTEGDSR